MKCDEITKLVDKQLKNVPGIRNRIKLIDATLQDNKDCIDDINRIKKEREQLNYKLGKIIKAVSTLKDDNQKIICYKYFEKLKYVQVAERLGYSSKTITRRIKKSLLSIGRVLFGFEDEFYSEVFGEYQEQGKVY